MTVNVFITGVTLCKRGVGYEPSICVCVYACMSVCLHVCLSSCLSHADIVSKRLHESNCFFVYRFPPTSAVLYFKEIKVSIKEGHFPVKLCSKLETYITKSDHLSRRPSVRDWRRRPVPHTGQRLSPASLVHIDILPEVPDGHPIRGI